jgi:hypothetical protein
VILYSHNFHKISVIGPRVSEKIALRKGEDRMFYTSRHLIFLAIDIVRKNDEICNVSCSNVRKI